MNVLVSVIIPVYNVEKYLEKCIESIVCQDYPNLEIIIVNDGSTDKSGTIVDTYAKKDERIKVISQPNSGLSAARNVGVSYSSGDYIMFVDGDDFISHDMVSRLLDVSRLSGADYVCSESKNFIDGDDQKAEKLINSYRDKKLEYELFETDEALIRMFYQKPSITGAYLKLYKNELVKKIPFPEGRYYEDFATTYSFIRNAAKIAFIKEKHYAYRMRFDSIMNQQFNNRKMDCIWVSELVEKGINNCNDDVKRAASCGIFRLNRLVYVQTPIRSTESEKVFEYILKYRKSVLHDSAAQLYERLLALSSYCGKGVFRMSLKLFSSLRLFRMIINVRLAGCKGK